MDREARDRDVGARRRLAAAQGSAEGVRGIVDHEEVVLVRVFPDEVPVADAAHQVRDQDRAGLFGNHIGDLVDTDLVVGEPDVQEDRRAAHVVDRRDVGGEGEGGRDHFAAERQVREAHRDHQCRRARVHHHPVAHAHVLGDAGLELHDLLAGHETHGIGELRIHAVDLVLVEERAAVADDAGLDAGRCGHGGSRVDGPARGCEGPPTLGHRRPCRLSAPERGMGLRKRADRSLRGARLGDVEAPIEARPPGRRSAPRNVAYCRPRPGG